jgi:hypothetical protein
VSIREDSSDDQCSLECGLGERGRIEGIAVCCSGESMLDCCSLHLTPVNAIR